MHVTLFIDSRVEYWEEYNPLRRQRQMCIRASIYFHQSQGGDEFVGRCAARLNLMNGEFASSPVFFQDSADRDAIKSAVNRDFPHFAGCDGMDRMRTGSMSG